MKQRHGSKRKYRSTAFEWKYEMLQDYRLYSVLNGPIIKNGLKTMAEKMPDVVVVHVARRNGNTTKFKEAMDKRAPGKTCKATK